MRVWIPFLTIFCFGFGSFLGKFALKEDSYSRVYFFEGMGTLTVLAIFLFYKRAEVFTIDFSINIPALLMGLLWGIGTVSFVIALNYGRAAIIVPLTALYPAVTVLFSVLFLNESLETKEILGVIFAILAGVLLTT